MVVCCDERYGCDEGVTWLWMSLVKALIEARDSSAPAHLSSSAYEARILSKAGTGIISECRLLSAWRTRGVKFCFQVSSWLS